jgi:hypothetical protein
MSNKFLIIVSSILLLVTAAFGQKQDRPRQVKGGEAVVLGDELLVKAVQGSAASFAGVKAKGEPFVVVLELDSGKKGVTLSYNASANLKSTDFYLLSGTEKFAPRALIEDFPSWGSDNDKELEVLDSKGTDGASTLQFDGKGSILLLFDVPAAQAKSPKKLSLVIRTVQPKDTRHELVVGL